MEQQRLNMGYEGTTSDPVCCENPCVFLWSIIMLLLLTIRLSQQTLGINCYQQHYTKRCYGIYRNPLDLPIGMKWGLCDRVACKNEEHISMMHFFYSYAYFKTSAHLSWCKCMTLRWHFICITQYTLCKHVLCHQFEATQSYWLLKRPQSSKNKGQA